jgi:excisionase family DNA binding protein
VQGLIDCGEFMELEKTQVMAPMKKLSEYVKTAEAAEILGVSQTTLRKWAESGKIPMIRNPINGYRLFQREDLDRFLEQFQKPTQKTRAKKG